MLSWLFGLSWRDPARAAASLLRSQEQMCVGYLYVNSSSYLARSCEILSSFRASARDPGMATERLFRRRRKGRVPSTTLLTVAVCAAASVQGSYAWGKVESPTLGKLKSRFWLAYKKFLPQMPTKALCNAQQSHFHTSPRQNKWVST